MKCCDPLLEPSQWDGYNGGSQHMYYRGGGGGREGVDCWIKNERNNIYRISSVIRQSFFLPKQAQRSKSILRDGSRSLGLFRKGKIGIIAKFHRTDLVIWSHSRGTKTLSYSRINTVNLITESFIYGNTLFASNSSNRFFCFFPRYFARLNVKLKTKRTWFVYWPPLVTTFTHHSCEKCIHD